jgi:hypothetical protein
MMWSGSASVVASGEVTTFFGAPLLLAVQLDEGPLTLEWVFEDAPEASISLEPTPGGHRLRCLGIDATPGRGTSAPVRVGTAGGDGIFLHFRSTRWGASVDRTIHFTVYRAPLDGPGEAS